MCSWESDLPKNLTRVRTHVNRVSLGVHLGHCGFLSVCVCARARAHVFARERVPV